MIASLTCYDASFATLVDESGTDLVLVGDSVGMVVQGHDTTVPVTLKTSSITAARGAGLGRPFLMADMPFMSYTSARAGAAERRAPDAGGRRDDGQARGRRQPGEDRRVSRGPRHSRVRAPGPRPQSVHKIGGFRVQGRDQAQAEQMQRDAEALEQAGADILLLECVPDELGKE